MGRLFLPLFATFLLAACATPGQAPSAAKPLDESAWASSGATFSWPCWPWWETFDSADLNAWMQRALADNPGLQEAAARVEAARAAAGQVRGSNRPRIELSGSSLTQHYPEQAGYDVPLAGGLESTQTVGVELRYALDFWGRNRAALRAAIGEAAARRAELDAARLLLAGEVANAWFQLAHHLERRALARETRHLRQRHLQLVQRRVDAGLDAASAAWLAQAQAAESARTLAGIDDDIAHSRHALAELAGTGPHAADDLTPSLPDSPAVLAPASIPAGLLGRRADIAAARKRMEAAAARIQQARAAFYPNIDLRAFAGLASLGLSHWLEAGSRTYGIEPAISLPLFDGGQLRAGLDQRRAEYDLAVAQYNANVLRAAREVADALGGLDAIHRQISQQQTVLEATQHAQLIAARRYAQGRDDYLAVLTTEERWVDARTAAIALRARSLEAHVGLASALGGGFESSASALADKSTSRNWAAAVGADAGL